MTTMNLPVLGADAGLHRYLQEIKKFPLLDPAEEYMLAKRWREHGDTVAAHRLVTSHLRLVAKIASGYRGYGLPLWELISEGNIGLMQAVKKFEPDKGFRLSTYAIWWIKAAIQEFVLKSWSMVKIGTSVAQKKLFFNLRRLKSNLDLYNDGQLSPEQAQAIADELNVHADEVLDMNGRLMAGDQSLNLRMGEDGQGSELLDRPESGDESQETVLVERGESQRRQALFARALEALSERERDILTQRRLTEPPLTLEDLSQKYSISRERVRQIETRAFEKLQKHVVDADRAQDAA